MISVSDSHPLLLLDAYNLLFRAFASLPAAIVDEGGRPINAVYGMVSSVVKLVRQFAPSGVVAAFDEPDVPTFRHRLYPDYQGHRGPLGGDNAEDFARQVDLARHALPHLGIPAPSLPGYEADDVMGSLACSVSAPALVVSTDRDLLQLVSPRVGVLSPSDKEMRVQDAAAVEARMGVPPGGITTFKALAGDASDHIPGVAGIGTKTAAALVQNYGTLDTIFANLSRLPPRQARALEAGKEDAYLFHKVVTIVTDLELPLSCADIPAPQVSGDSRITEVLRRAGIERK